MPRRVRVLLWVVAVVILLPAAAVAVFAFTFDPDVMKPRIIEAVRQATGRELRLGGRLGLSLALRPTLEAEDVGFANTAGGSRPEMATIRRVRVRIALLPLLQRRLVVDSVQLEQPEILLETDAAGQGNWRMTPPARPAAAPAPAAEPKADGFDIAVRHVTIGQGKITWRDGRTGQTGTAEFPDLTLDEDGPAAPMLVNGQVVAGALTARFNLRGAPLAGLATAMLPGHVDVDGTLSGQKAAFTMDLTGGTDGVAPIAVDAAATLGSSTLSVKGNVAKPAALAGLDLAVVARIADPVQLASLFGQAAPAAGALAFDGRVAGDAKGTIALHGFKLTSQAGVVTGDVTIGATPVPAIRGTLASARLDLDALRAAAATPTPPGGSPGPAARPPASPRLIPDTPLPLDALRRANADVQVNVAQLVDDGVTIGDLAFHLVLADGRLVLDPLAAQLPGGPMQGALSLDASQPAAQLSLRLRAPGLAVQSLLAAFHMPPLARGPIDLLADLRGAGRSPRAIAATLSGTLGLAMQGGQIDEAAVQKALGPIARTANLPTELMAASGETALNCFALRMDFAAGRGTLLALLLDSAREHVEGDGTVNLGDESLALNLRPLARLGGTGVAVPLRVGGSFAAPRAQIDAGAVVGAIAGGGGFKAVIGALSHAASSQSCAPELAVARGGAVPAAAAAPPAGGKTLNPADLLKQLFR